MRKRRTSNAPSVLVLCQNVLKIILMVVEIIKTIR